MKAVFLDRDGVINRDSPDYIKSWDEFEFLPSSRQAIALLCKAGLDVFVVTNQSVINRGMVSRKTLEDMHKRMAAGIEDAGGRIKDIFYCPHRPEDDCNCRKPAPGLILQALAKHGIMPVDAVMVGDSLKDMEAANQAGLERAVLVRTGNGWQAQHQYAKLGLKVDFVADDLLEAARWICSLGRQG
ncbi:MAG: D-glycero-beta-D-manno-heptose 1,7-bisphosphate 7-phosphatase [Desulfatibacillaceae bacterium]|nr:D-glycero-beta-D-manno-heptose 1,7-bisphosphate 7-phosphatase [Desulfatibacillaceae bacterium]